PLVIVSSDENIYVYDVVSDSVVSKLRGHGGDVTAIAVHPDYPDLFCTTSRDFTSRLYELTFSPRQVPHNVHWPPSKVMSLGGAPHGLQSSESEGEGFGCCMAIFAGGPSGGHEAPILGAVSKRMCPIVIHLQLNSVVW
ncbi:hypothetical protein CONPUDRAFT_44031, partial [Coniophora puteana RWD-64-598 SS2]